MEKFLLPSFIILLFVVTQSVMHDAIADDEHAAFYSGEINRKNNRNFFQHNAGRKIRRLLITSTGGEVEAGIQLGRWVYDNKLDVEVREICLSSCANYIFPAGRGKHIHPGAIVAWHGNYIHLKETGSWEDDVKARMAVTGETEDTARQQVKKEMLRLAEMEESFFRYIRVDQHLCWAGKREPYNAADYYFLSAEDMRRFGLTGLQLPENYIDTDVSAFDVSIVYIRLK